MIARAAFVALAAWSAIAATTGLILWVATRRATKAAEVAAREAHCAEMADRCRAVLARMVERCEVEYYAAAFAAIVRAESARHHPSAQDDT